ncbi:hypothetical protein [Dechloromonas denitrificans]|uniref:hypothetical protein n=1 Tax=Dechloromonas denitrificans TaxID=281362 RepID=UPI00083292BB|nr:hypothetical protein [Dechloromonas denitrificans]
MKIEEISFREWVLCKVRRRGVPAETPPLVSETPPVSEMPAPPCETPRRRVIRPVPFKVRRAGDRRLDEAVAWFTGRERRRTPERRIPEVEEASFAEFERWKRQSDLR